MLIESRYKALTAGGGESSNQNTSSTTFLACLANTLATSFPSLLKTIDRDHLHATQKPFNIFIYVTQPRMSPRRWRNSPHHSFVISLNNNIWEACILGCTDTPFLASCPCPTRVGHRNGYDAPDSGVRQCLFFFFFFRFSDTAPTRLRRGPDTAPTRLRRVRHASSEKKKKKKEKKHRFWQVDLPIPLISW